MIDTGVAVGSAIAQLRQESLDGGYMMPPPDEFAVCEPGMRAYATRAAELVAPVCPDQETLVKVLVLLIHYTDRAFDRENEPMSDDPEDGDPDPGLPGEDVFVALAASR